MVWLSALTRRKRPRSSFLLPLAKSAKKASPAGSGTIGLRNELIRAWHIGRTPLPCWRVCGICSQAWTLDRLGTPMADHSEVAYTTADGNDYEAHEQTYEGFIMLVKYGTASVIAIVALMAIFLT